MPFRVASDGYGKVIPVLVADILYEVEGASEAAIDGLPLLRAAGRVTTEGHQVADTTVFAVLQSLVDLRRLHVCAGEVHVGDAAVKVLRVVGECHREVRGGAAGSPSEVNEQRAERPHPLDAPAEVGDAVLRLGREELQREPLAGLRGGDDVAHLLVLLVGRHGERCVRGELYEWDTAPSPDPFE